MNAPIHTPMFSLIVPVYRNEESLPDLLNAIAELHQHLDAKLEAVLVIDGSPDRCFEILREELPHQPFPATLALLSRNFGSFAAIRVGLEQARGQFFAVMAADLQEPPKMVVQMFKTLQTQPLDVVVGKRNKRNDPFLQRIQAQAFWSLYRRFVVPQMPAGGVDIFACNTAFRDALLNLSESRTSLIAQIFWLGFRRGSVPYVRQARKHGKSAWTWSQKVAYLADSVFAFTDLPIRWLTRTGILGMVLAFGLGLGVLVSRLTGGIAVPGYAMTLIVILFFGALNVFGLGIVGTYAWRAYENTKQRPHAVALSVTHFD